MRTASRQDCEERKGRAIVAVSADGKDPEKTTAKNSGPLSFTLQTEQKLFSLVHWCTDKKENQTFLIYREIQNGAVAKSYMTNGLLIYGEIFPHFLIY
jgi:hypothetical protein